MNDTNQSTAWRLDLDAADALVERMLVQRDADRRNKVIHNAYWASVAEEVYGWRAKTYLAAIMCGLVARATDARANPLSLQVGDPGSFGYSAPTLWQIIRSYAQGNVDLRNLKNQPFNNSPFYGKRLISRDWENVSPANRPILERTVELLERIAEMDGDQAVSALRGFLYNVPDDPARRKVGVLTAERLDLVGFFDRLNLFLESDGEQGRRAQAMVAAALALVHPDRIDTPRSVNDPSRKLAGDVRVLGEHPDSGRYALYAEAKQTRVEPELVDQFADEVRRSDDAGVAAYGALVNARSYARSRRALPLPSWREVLAQRGVVMAIWEDPAVMVRDALVWSGLDIRTGIGMFVERYVSYLQYIEVDVATITELAASMAEVGIEVSTR